ncbi:MAG: efflux RND transporter permease subunit, partial [Nannocystaceae bacterium]
MNDERHRNTGLFERLALWCVQNRIVVGCLALALLVGGLVVMPFRGGAFGIPRDPISVDALPDITDNQQIVFARWEGRSPQDVSDQVTYPLSVALLGAPGVRSIRTTSMFGFASVNVIFEDDVDFFWSRSRILEKLASMPSGALPEGVVPTLGPEATGLGQIYWYTLEARDGSGRPVGDAFSLDELRAIQDWNVKYALQGVPGVAEVASVGGFVREYQIVVDRDAMRVHGVTLGEVVSAVRAANRDVGARTMEINGVEYVIRGL